MCGSFNNYAQKARNANLPLRSRASAFRSCVRLYCCYVGEPSFTAMVAHLGAMVGADLYHAAEESHLLDALRRMESVRNQVMEIQRMYERKRIRQKFRGRYAPSKADAQALAEAFEAIRRSAGMLPLPKPIIPV